MNAMFVCPDCGLQMERPDGKTEGATHVHVMPNGEVVMTRMVRDLRAEDQGKTARDMVLVSDHGHLRPIIQKEHMKRLRPLNV